MVCPTPDCKVTIDINIIKGLIDSQIFERYENFVMNNLKSANPDIKFIRCPTVIWFLILFIKFLY